MRLQSLSWLRRSRHVSRPPLASCDTSNITSGEPTLLGRSNLSPPPQTVLWSAAHASLLDDLFGDGYVMPGGLEEISKLARLIGRLAEQDLLLVGAGTGGPVLSLAAEFGSHVSGFETVPAFACLAEERIRRAKLGVRASVQAWSPSAPAFTPQSFQHALAIMPLRGGVPENILAAIGAAIKPGGHLVLVEVVANSPFHADEKLMKPWLTLEGRQGAIPGEAVLTGLIERLGFAVRVVEDETNRHMHMVVLGWQRLLQTIKARPGPSVANVLIAEAERWLFCLELMRAGRLRLVRWHAVQNSDQRIDLGSIKLELMLAIHSNNWRSAIDLWNILLTVQGLDSEINQMREFIRSGISRDNNKLSSEIKLF